MFVAYEERPSDSPFVDAVWRCRSERAGTLLSIAAGLVEIVVTRHQASTIITVRGPETHARTLDYPTDAEWVGIRFKVGTFMPRFLPGQLRDGRDVNLVAATKRSFWLNGSAIEYPTFDHVEAFIARLSHRGELHRDRRVEAALRGEEAELSLRSVQRHVLRATGLTLNTRRQIERARQATDLLKAGVSILDVVRLAGYYDQAHLTRSVKHRIGQTPTELQRGRAQLSMNLHSAQVSFPYKTGSPR